jgi:hypothetical protein
VRLVLAPPAANVQNNGLVPQRLHEAIQRNFSVHIQVDVAVLSGFWFQVSLRSLRHMGLVRLSEYCLGSV